MATAIALPTSSGNLISSTGPIKVMGWSARIDANAVSVDLRETGSGGKIIACINLVASGGDTQWFGEQGVICNSGVLYATVTGTATALQGSVWVE